MSRSKPQARIGRMRNRAELQKLSQVPDGAGGWNTEWVKERDIWCWISPSNGSERLESMRQDVEISHEIVARYNSDITKEKRIVHRGRVFEIKAVWSPEERQEYSQMLAIEGGAT